MIGSPQTKGKQKYNTITFKKSPTKYDILDSTSQTNIDFHDKNSTQNQNSWNTPQYHTLKKIPDEYASLRQTFDYRNNSKLQAKLAQSNFDDHQSKDKVDTMLRQTFHTRKTTFNTQNDLSSSVAVEKGYGDELHVKKEKKSTKGGTSEKQIALDSKLKSYMGMLDKFKDQLQTNSRMSQQLKKLKEDRRKRLEGKDKQFFKNELESPPQLQLYKNKNSTFTPQLRKEETHEDIKLTSSYDLEKNLRRQKKFTTMTQLPKPYTSELKKNLSECSKMSRKGGEVNLDQFILGKSLGQGKFGTVYQAIHKATGFLFAVKKIPKQMIKSHLMVDQFILQLKLQTFLSHPNVLSIFTHFDDKEYIYLVLEYMEQGTLFSHLKKQKKLSEHEVSVKMRQVSSAIRYLHENSIAHRDIKPQNVVVSHGVCKLCDFGWATICDDRRKTYCGTFDYAPPQILEGVEYDYTVDLWCLGVLAYELLVGKAPFYHISRKQTMKRILNVENQQVEYPKNLSRNTIEFIDNLLKKDPTERTTAEDLLEHPFLKDSQKN